MSSYRMPKEKLMTSASGSMAHAIVPHQNAAGNFRRHNCAVAPAAMA
jgi:hypothetical protein